MIRGTFYKRTIIILSVLYVLGEIKMCANRGEPIISRPYPTKNVPTGARISEPYKTIQVPKDTTQELSEDEIYDLYDQIRI